MPSGKEGNKQWPVITDRFWVFVDQFFWIGGWIFAGKLTL